MNEKNIHIFSTNEIKYMKTAGLLASKLLNYLSGFIHPGISSRDIDIAASIWGKKYKIIHAPFGYFGFPKKICTSINNVICHGIPNKNNKLKKGDIINIDITIIVNGYHADTSKTFYIPPIDPSIKHLLTVAKKALHRGISEVAPNRNINNIGASIEKYINTFDYSIAKDFAGHGIGKLFHTNPTIKHFGIKKEGLLLKEGMIFTIEPIVNKKENKIKLLQDKWTIVTHDGNLSAQFEHTILVTKNGFKILTL